MGGQRVNLVNFGSSKKLLIMIDPRRGNGETFRHSQRAELQLQELVTKLIASS